MLEEGEIAMRPLALCAGVSEATPYNLFGIKRHLVAALYAQDCDAFLVQLGERTRGDALTRLFEALDLYCDNLAARPHYHRTLMAELYGPGRVQDAGGPDPGIAVWLALIGALERDGLIDPAIPADRLTTAFVHLLSGAVLEWTRGLCTIETLRNNLAFGLRLCLKGASSHTAAHHPLLA